MPDGLLDLWVPKRNGKSKWNLKVFGSIKLPIKSNILLTDLLFPYFQTYLKFLNNEKNLEIKIKITIREGNLVILLCLMDSEIKPSFPPWTHICFLPLLSSLVSFMGLIFFKMVLRPLKDASIGVF